MARPRKTINVVQLRKLASIGCTNEEIASVLGCAHDLLERRFACELAKGRAQSHERLRRMQWKAAEAGNATMLIWLGKQMLGQRDQAQHDINGNLNLVAQIIFRDAAQKE